MSRSSAERSRLESKRVQAHSSDVKVSGTLNTGSQKLNGTYIREGRKEGRKEGSCHNDKNELRVGNKLLHQGKVMKTGNIAGKETQSRTVYSIDGVSPTLCAGMDHGNTMPYIEETRDG